MDVGGKHEVHTRRDGDAYERQQICRRNDSAFVLIRGFVLDQSIDRHRKKSCPEPEH